VNLADVMDQVADRLDTISGLRTFAYPADSVVPPVAVVGYPEQIVFDATYGRGSDQISLPVWVLVGKVSARSTRDLIAPYAAGSGPSSVKEVLESGDYTAFDSLQVTVVEFDVLKVAGGDFLAAGFNLDIAGKGH
jgi:hypothetical protein